MIVAAGKRFLVSLDVFQTMGISTEVNRESSGITYSIFSVQYLIFTINIQWAVPTTVAECRVKFCV